MKRKDFLNKMRNRRRGDALELREPERRRAIDWRTLRVELPAAGEILQQLPVGEVILTPDGLALRASEPCWVRGYRMWLSDDGGARAECQYRPAETGEAAPPGAAALAVGETWTPDAEGYGSAGSGLR